MAIYRHEKNDEYDIFEWEIWYWKTLCVHIIKHAILIRTMNLRVILIGNSKSNRQLAVVSKFHIVLHEHDIRAWHS